MFTVALGSHWCIDWQNFIKSVVYCTRKWLVLSLRNTPAFTSKQPIHWSIAWSKNLPGSLISSFSSSSWSCSSGHSYAGSVWIPNSILGFRKKCYGCVWRLNSTCIWQVYGRLCSLVWLQFLIVKHIPSWLPGASFNRVATIPQLSMDRMIGSRCIK